MVFAAVFLPLSCCFSLHLVFRTQREESRRSFMCLIKTTRTAKPTRFYWLLPVSRRRKVIKVGGSECFCFTSMEVVLKREEEGGGLEPRVNHPAVSVHF